MEASSKPSFSNALCSAVILCGLLVAGLASAAQVYRWVDENGEVHYSESLPPDYHDKDQGHDVLNQQGMVVEEDRKLTPPPPAPPSKEEPQELPRDASGLPRPKAAYSETEMQQRMDSFLMLRYESEQEILDAMSVEIKQLNYDRRLLEASQASTDAAFRGHVKLAADRQRAGLAVEKSTARRLLSMACRNEKTPSGPILRSSWNDTATWSRPGPTIRRAAECTRVAPPATPSMQSMPGCWRLRLAATAAPSATSSATPWTACSTSGRRPANGRPNREISPYWVCRSTWKRLPAREKIPTPQRPA